LVQYSKTAGQNPKLELLDLALKADSTNPRVTEEIAKLLALGKKASPELMASLEENLTNGDATAVTHLMVGNRRVMDSKLAEAVGHFEIASRMAPGAPPILNNLALALTRNSPEDPEVLKRAEMLMMRALHVAGPSAELFDSLGEIRATAGNH